MHHFKIHHRSALDQSRRLWESRAACNLRFAQAWSLKQASHLLLRSALIYCISFVGTIVSDLLFLCISLLILICVLQKRVISQRLKYSTSLNDMTLKTNQSPSIFNFNVACIPNHPFLSKLTYFKIMSMMFRICIIRLSA